MSKNSITNSLAEDKLRLQIVIGALVITFANWYVWITSKVEFIAETTAVFTILPILLGAYLVMLAIAYVPTEHMIKHRPNLMVFANYFYAASIAGFISGETVLVVAYLLGGTTLKIFLAKPIFGFPLFGWLWLFGSLILLSGFYGVNPIAIKKRLRSRRIAKKKASASRR